MLDVLSPTVGLAVKAHFASYFMTQKSDVEYVELPGTTIKPCGHTVVRLVANGCPFEVTLYMVEPLVAYRA